MTVPANPLLVDDFRRSINAGLERQGMVAVWRPEGASPWYDCQQRNPSPVAVRNHWSQPETHSAASQHVDPRLGREDWEPAAPAPQRAIRRACSRQRYYLRPWQRPRIRACGFAMLAAGGTVGVAVAPDGRASYQGLATCGSVWECPCCAMKIKARRAEEVRQVVERHGADRCALLTLTVRHGFGDDLKRLRVSLADAWRGFTRGKSWKRFVEAAGVVGTIRALEVTHGANGWHPHLHILLLIDDPDAIDADGQLRWDAPDLSWLSKRWRTMVARYCGAKHEPDDQHGVTIAPCRASDYISKLGLELSDPGAKVARGKGRTPLEIAQDIADATHAVKRGQLSRRIERDRDVALWRLYCEAMRGARQLTWKRGLKASAGIRDRTDLEVAQDEEPAADAQAVIVGQLSADEWAAVRSRRVGSEDAAHWCLRQAEQFGGPGLRRAVRAVVEGRAGVVGTR